ncbi:MAG TPA: Uma2 family endonuclease [Thermomicrobiales bacterium]
MVQSAMLPPQVRGVWYPMTWEEFLEWSPSEGQAEWVDGKGIAYLSNSTLHGDRVVFLGQLLGLFCRVMDVGSVFFDNILIRLPNRPSGRMPDVMVVRREWVRERWVEGMALIAIEFLSEDSVHRDLVEKRAEFEGARIPEYPMIDGRPGQREFHYLRLDEAGHYQEVEPDDQGRYHSAVLPGFWLDPNWFWEDPLPNVERLMMRFAPEAYRRYLTRLWDEESAHP